MTRSMHFWKFLDFVPFLPAALAVVVLQWVYGCESQSQNIPGETSGIQATGPRVDAATRSAVINDVAVTIRKHYADREAGNVLADKILADLEKGRSDSLMDAKSLVEEVTSVIRTMVSDRHFAFSVRGEPKIDLTASPDGQSSEHGLRTLRMLEHDTVYLEFDGLPGDDASLRFVEQALEELPEVKALILDIRSNIGGSGDMVVLLCSHLLEAGTLLYKYYDRSGGPPGEMKATPYRRHFGPDIPVFVLISRATLSAAEALAFILQDYGRAKVVGQRSPGMANPSRTFPIGEDFELTVPFLLLHYGKSGGTYAGVGVVPDMAVPADSALDTVLAEIRAKFAFSEY